MRTVNIVAGLMAGWTLVGCASVAPVHTSAAGGDVVLTSPAAEQLRNDMRRLWSDHVTITREFIIGAAGGDPNLPATQERLMSNQDDIGAAIVPFYGSAAGSRLAALLRDHISIAAELVSAAKAGDDAKVEEADSRWRGNAADIATFLANANPNWTRSSLLEMMNEHLTLTTLEAKARLEGRLDDDARIFAQVHHQALMMAEALANGIITQFPGRF